MQPQQPYTNPYDFIVNPQKPQRPSLINLNGGGMGSLKLRIAVVGVGIVLLIIIISVIGSLFSGGGNTVNMTSVAQDQSELIRVTTEATQDQSNDIQQNTTLYFAQNCELSVSSEQQRLLAFLTSHGVKLSSQQLALKQNSRTDSALSAAAASSTYDTTFLNVMQGDMNTYISDIKVAYAASSNPQEKQVLQTDYHDVELLQLQLTNAKNNVNAGT